VRRRCEKRDETPVGFGMKIKRKPRGMDDGPSAEPIEYILCGGVKLDKVC